MTILCREKFDKLGDEIFLMGDICVRNQKKEQNGETGPGATAVAYSAS